MRDMPRTIEIPRWLIVVGIIIVLAIASTVWNAVTGGDSPTRTTAAPSRCRSVPAAQLEVIADGLTVQGGGSLRNGFAVTSDDYDNVDFVAADIQGPGLEGEGDVGVWAVGGSLANPSAIMAINATADEFSTWPLGSSTDFNVTMSDDGAAEARDCSS